MIGKVMIVVEGELYGQILAREFESRGYEVCAVVDNGEEAIKTAMLEYPETVVMEFLLQGGLNGIETARIIQSDTAATVVFLNNRLEHEWFYRAGEIGAARVVDKQETPASIVDGVRNLVLASAHLKKENRPDGSKLNARAFHG